MKRKHKVYSRPKRPYDKKRIQDEAVIVEKFGLKNKKEIWKAEAKINVIREKAKSLISASEDEKSAFFGRLKKIGLDVNSIADVLSLNKEDYLKRRLQTLVFEKKLAPTIKSARQMITHKKIFVGEGIVNSPAYLVRTDAESAISLKNSRPKRENPKLPIIGENVNGE
ncbi:MAG: 30S ribosomal protein S4 [Nanoarchaeota archaeon]|nr:30S ribosomal protein S4 [Nanoarchaeota archaeon]